MSRMQVPFARLEDRVLLDAEPTVSIEVEQPGTDLVELGSTFTARVSFDNASPIDVGYGPYIDLILPTTGSDGAGAALDDGITFVNATYLGVPVVATQIVFDGSGNASHPYAVDTAGNPVAITGTPGDTLVVLQLPFGSFTPDQTAADVVVTLQMSNLADLDKSLTIAAGGGFRYGNDPLGNPSTDPSIRAPMVTDAVRPTVIDLEKVYIGPEDETATGPNYVRSYELRVDIATGQTVADVVVTDFLPPEMVPLSATITTGSGTITMPAGFGAPLSAPNNQLTANLGSITGAAGVDAVVTIQYYIGEFQAGGSAVLAAGSGADDIVTNTARVTGTFDTIDGRDPNVSVFDDETLVDPTSERHDLEASPLVIQKSSSIVVDNQTSGLSPGDVIEYTLQVQVSDYFSVGDIIVNDLLSDGQRFDASFAPRLSFNDDVTSGASSAFAVANYTVVLNADNNRLTPLTDGSTAIAFRVSDELVRVGNDGVLVGGLAADPTRTVNNGATTATITYRAIVQSSYSDTYPSGEAPVGQGDQISNSVDISATIRNNANTSIVTDTTSDDSGVTLEIVRGAIAKSIYAVNGDTGYSSNQIQAGDEITFRITYDLPLSKVENFEVRDFLPLPVFTSGEVAVFDIGGPSAGTPLAGHAKLGPTDTFTALSAIRPTISENAGSNQLNFTYGNFAADPAVGTRVDILFTVTVVDQDFVDGLFLTNQATGVEANTGTTAVQSNAIVNFVYEQPELEITKGVVAKSDDGTFTSGIAPAGVTFPAPGVVGDFTGTISSAGLAVTPVDSNLTGIDAGDVVKFAIVVENIGNADDGAFDVRIRDALPPGFAIPAGGAGLNLRVTDGAGNPLVYSGTDLFGAGIELTDGATQGALATYNATSGRNIVVITYDLVAVQAIEPEFTTASSATLSNYAAFNGGIDRTPVDLTDAASVTTTSPTVDKVIVSTSHDVTGSTTGATATIGEVITYDIVVTLPEGTIDGVTLSDLALPTNNGTLEILTAEIRTIGSNISHTSGFLAGSTAVPVDGPDADSTADQVSFAFGRVVNAADNVSNAADQITFRVTARVDNDAGTTAGDTLVNRGEVTYQDAYGNVRTQGDNEAITVVEPTITIDEAIVTPGPYDAGDIVTYSITITNQGGGTSATGYDLAIADLLSDPRLDLVDGTVTITGSPAYAGASVSSNTTTVGIAANELRVGDSITVTFQARIASTTETLSVLNTTATVGYSSLPTSHPGGDSQERDYATNDGTALTIASPSIDKVLVSTGHSGTGATNDPNVTIGEEIVYRITVTVPEGVIANAVLSDLVLASNPGTLELVSARIVSIGANLSNTAGLVVGSSVTPTDGPDAGSVADAAAFSFGTITNSVDNVQDGRDQVTIEVRARVFDDAATARGDILTNRGQFTFTGGSVVDDVSVTVVEPTLVIDKVAPVGPIDGGDAITYSITISHASASNATAYDIAVEDLLADVNLDLVPGTVTVSSLAYGTRTVTTGNGASDTTVNVAISELRVGDTITISFQGRASATLPVNTTINNTADLDYTSLPEGTLPGSSTVDRDYTGSDTATVSARLPGLTKAVVDTSITQTGSAQDTAAPDLTVGELVTYELVVEVPEGTSPLTLVDQLPTSLSTPNGVLSVVSASVVSKGANISANALTPTITIADSAGDSDGLNDRVTFDFGTVINTPDGVRNVADLITVRIVARVEDAPQNIDGDTLINTGTLTFGSGPTQGTVTATANVDVVEPVLNIDKAVSTVTPLVDACDIATFTLTIDHTAASTSTAFDLVISDLINDPALALVAGTVSVTGGTGVTVTTGNTAGDTTIRLDVEELDQNQTITVTYQARITNAAVFGATGTNTANLSWDSNPAEGVGVVERTGTDLDTATVAFARPTFDKSIVSTTITQTGSGEHTPSLDDLAIGEEVTFALVMTLPEGSSQITLTDQLPQLANGRLGYVSSSVVSLGGASGSGLLPVGSAGTPTDSNADGILDQVSFNFGNLTNIGDNAAGNNQVVVYVTARVLDIPANADGDLLTSPATMTYTDGTPTPATLTDSVQVDIVEPVLNIDKAVSTVTPLVDAGDIATFTLTIDHTAASTSTAFDLVISDLVNDPALALVAGTVSVTGGTGVTVTTGNTAGDTTIRLDVEELAQNQTITVTYQARITNAAVFGATGTNTANLSWDSNPAEGVGVVERTGTDLDTATVAFARPTFDKSVFSTSVLQTGIAEHDGALDDLVVGEDVTFNLVMTLPEGTSTINLIDNLPGLATGKLGYVSSQVITLGGATSSLLAVGSSGTASDSNADGIIDRVAFNFGTVVNPGDNDATNNQIVVRVTARVLDVAENADADNLTNSATVTYTDGSATPPTLTDTAAVNIVEPVLAITKVANTEAANPGDVVTYTLTVNHTTGSSANAFDVVISDLLADANLQFVPGSVTVNGAAASPTVTTLVGDGFEVRLAEITQTETVTITYQATVLATAPRTADFDNTANLAWDSRPGNGDLTTTADDGRTGTTSASDRIFTPPTIEKSVVTTNNSSTGTGQFDGTLTDLTVGETVTYNLTVTLPETTNRNLVITDIAPAGLELLTARVVSSGMSITAPVITTTGGQVTFDFGNVANPFDGTTGADDVIILEVTGRVRDVVGNVDGTVLTNQANLAVRIGAGTPGNPGDEARDFTANDTVDVEIVEPILTIDKSRNIASGDAGTEITYTLVVSHDTTPGVSHANAHDVVIEDLIADPDLQLVAGSVTTTAGTVTALGGDGFRVNVAEIPLGGTVTITYRALILNTAVIGDTLPNTATLTWDSQPGTGGRTGTANDTESVIVDRAPIGFTKEVFTTAITETGSGVYDPALVDLAIGELVTYRLTATLAEGSDTIVIVDNLPFDGGVFEFVSARVVSVGGNITLLGPTSITNADTKLGDGINETTTFNFGNVINAFDNVVTDADRIVVEVVGLVRNLPQNQEGDRVAAPATLTSTTGTIDASVDVEVVEPEIVLDKSASHQARFHGEVVTYTVVVRNTGTGPAFDLDIGDTLPAGIRLVAGSVSLTGVTGTVLETSTGFDATLARLMPGETATLTYKATVMYAARGGDTLFNDATVTASSIPEAERDSVLAALPGRTAGEVVRGHDAADRVGTLILVPSSELSSPRAVSGLIDDERFMPLISLNPFFSGTAEYGSHVTITLRDSSGAIVGTRGGFADAGGNWVASFPLSTIEIENDLERDRDTYFVTSRLFSDSQGLLGSHSGSLARSHWADREVFVGTRLLDQAYSVEVHQDLASYNAGLDGAFNARAYFTPVITNEVFGQERQLDIQKVFEGRAEFALDQLYEASLSPLGMGGNRYTNEFLAIAGSASGR